MRIADQNWMDVESCLAHDDRAILPLGSTEQHAYLSLATDSLLAERVSVEAAAPLGIPVFPVLSYGITPRFMAYPGTVSISVATYVRLVMEIVDGLYRQGFRRIVLVNGHGGNTPAQVACSELLADHPGLRLKWHDWWRAPKTWAKVLSIDPVASHASWMEHFPWTRVPALLPREPKPPVDFSKASQLSLQAFRDLLGDGNFAGAYEQPEDAMLDLWQVAVEETREILELDWV